MPNILAETRWPLYNVHQLDTVKACYYFVGKTIFPFAVKWQCIVNCHLFEFLLLSLYTVGRTSVFGRRTDPVPRQTSEYGTQVVMTWRMWANISHVGGMWVLDGFLLPMWEEYGSAVGGSIRTSPYGTHMGQIWANIFGILVKGSHMVLIWALYGFIAHMGQALVPHGQKYVNMPI